MIQDRWYLTDIIDEGAFGKIFNCTDLSDKVQHELICKIVSVNFYLNDYFIDEYR